MNGYGNSKNDEELILMMEQMQDELEDMCPPRKNRQKT